MRQNSTIPGQLPDTLILPVETLNREFDAKLHLGLRAISRGWSVIIGGRTALHSWLPHLPRSIYLSKGIRTGNRRILKLFEQLGHVVVSLDEESLIRQSDEAHLLMLDEETFNRPRLLYAWGKSNADTWRDFKGYRGTPILEVGNPRIDLLRPELAAFYAADADALRARFGRFVLLSSNFSMANHYIKGHVRFRTAKGGNSKRTEEMKSGLVAHKTQLFEAFRAMVPSLARAIAPVNLVIRPHPSENTQTWASVAEGLDGAHVSNEGPIAPWIMAADALVHNGCTSAVEAAIIGTQAFSFKPQVSAVYDAKLPDSLSHSCYSEESLIAAVKQSLDRGPRPASLLSAEQLALLRHHVASVDGLLSCERILDSLENNPAMRENLRQPGLPTRLRGLANHYQRRAVRALTTRLPRAPSNAGYTAHKFPGITDALIAGRIERFRSLVANMPLPQCRQLADNIFLLEGVGHGEVGMRGRAAWSQMD